MVEEEENKLSNDNTEMTFSQVENFRNYFRLFNGVLSTGRTVEWVENCVGWDEISFFTLIIIIFSFLFLHFLSIPSELKSSGGKKSIYQSRSIIMQNN